MPSKTSQSEPKIAYSTIQLSSYSYNFNKRQPHAPAYVAQVHHADPASPSAIVMHVFVISWSGILT